MRIQHNIMAMSAYRNYNTNTSAVAKNLEKLSSGYKINRAGDDAAGLAISEKMRAQITGLNAAQKNVKDGISLVKTAEGAMQEIQDMLNRMDYLATQSANGTYDNEVDRNALQKEVSQLKEEINRIADSANFNGIKLLDGKLGLNDDAFSVSSAAAVEATDGSIDVSSLLAKETDGSPKVHLEEKSATAKTPAAVIDLGDLKMTGSKQNDTLTINVLGKDYTLTAANDGDFDTTAGIATALAAEMNKEIQASDGTTGTPDAANIGGAAFTAAVDGDNVKLTFAGSNVNGTWKAGTTFEGDQALADAINEALGSEVKVGDSTGSGVVSGDVIHMVTNVDHAVAAKNASKAGIDISLSDLVKDGNSLTIDGKTFFFKTDANSTATAPTGATVIDVSAYDADEQVHAAADLLSKETVTGQDNRTWKIGVNGDGTTIHIGQDTASDTGKELDTYNKLVGVISAQGQAQSAANVGTKIKVDDAKVQEGDTLTIDGKTYVFADKATTDIPEGAVQVAIKGGAAKNLAAKITGSEFDAASNTVTVRAAKAEDTIPPQVLGKGLQLQIGDTSDSYNQLKVKVGDMHTSAMGIADLDIGNQDDAADAIQTIRNAINYVSGVRGDLGATQNRLEHTANNLSVMAENIQDAESTIRDTDIAEEMMSYTKNNILVQASQAMLAQANQAPQGVLQLLQ